MRRGGRRGSAHMEFALLLPVLLTIIFGIMEYGWLFFQRTAVQEAMRQGCRQGATLDPLVDDIDAEVEMLTLTALAGLGVRCDDGACVVRTTVQGAHPTQRLRCVAEVDYRPLVRLVPVPEQLSAGYVYYLEVQ